MTSKVSVGGSPVADVAGSVLVQRTPRPSSYPVNVLVTLGRVLRKVDPRPEHASDVRVPLVEALVDDGVNERRTCVGAGENKDLKKNRNKVLQKGSPFGIRLWGGLTMEQHALVGVVVVLLRHLLTPVGVPVQ